MQHAEPQSATIDARLGLARALLGRLAATYGDALVLGGVFGSAARGEASEWSDLDLLVVTRAGAALQSRALLVRGTLVSLSVIAEDALAAELGGPGAAWPFWMGVLAELRPLVGDAAQIARWSALGMALDARAFRARVEPLLPGLVFEAYGRLRTRAASGESRDTAALGVELVYELQRALCLLNRRWVTRDYYAGVAQSFGFPLRPEGYELLAPRLVMGGELAEIVGVAGELVGAYWRLLAAEGALVPNYQKVDDVPL